MSIEPTRESHWNPFSDSEASPPTSPIAAACAKAKVVADDILTVIASSPSPSAASPATSLSPRSQLLMILKTTSPIDKDAVLFQFDRLPKEDQRTLSNAVSSTHCIDFESADVGYAGIKREPLLLLRALEDSLDEGIDSDDESYLGLAEAFATEISETGDYNLIANLVPEKLKLAVLKVILSNPDSLDDVIWNFKNFNIIDISGRIEIIKMMLSDPEHIENVVSHFKDFQITDDEERKAVIKLILSVPGGAHAVTTHLEDLGIVDEDEQIELIKLMFSIPRGPYEVAMNFEHFTIVDDKKKLPIIKALIRDSEALNVVVKFFSDFHITDESIRLEIAETIIQSPSVDLETIKLNFGLPPVEQRRLLILGIGYKIAQKTPPDEEILILNNCRTLLRTIPEFSSISDDLDKTALFSIVLGLLVGASPSPQIAKICAYRNKTLVISCLHKVLTQAKNKPDYLEAHDRFTDKAIHLSMPMAFIADWSGESPEANRVALKIKQLLTTSAMKESLRNNFSDAKKTLIETALALENTNLSPEQQLNLLAFAIENDTYLKVQFLCNLGFFDWGSPEGFRPEGLDHSIKQEMQDKLFGGLPIPPGFLDSFLEYSKTERTPFSLEIYLAKIRSLDDPKLSEIAFRLVNSLISGTFHTDRYNVAGNPHFRDMDADLVTRWSSRVSQPRTTKETEKGDLEVVVTDNFQDLFNSGYEVPGSCQCFNGDVAETKCLFAICMDPKIKMIAVTDPKTDKIVSRALIKLLMRDGKPALFFDRIYAHTKSYDADLKRLALEYAAFVGAAVYEHAEHTTSGPPISSFGSNAPYEYEDGAAGISVGGVYDIRAYKELII